MRFGGIEQHYKLTGGIALDTIPFYGEMIVLKRRLNFQGEEGFLLTPWLKRDEFGITDEVEDIVSKKQKYVHCGVPAKNLCCKKASTLVARVPRRDHRIESGHDRQFAGPFGL